MFQQCYIQYSKYGSYIPLEQIGQSFDVRIAQQFLFYIVFIALSGAISSEAMSKGVSFSRAVAIIFLLNELEQLVYYQEKIEAFAGQQSDLEQILNKNKRIEFINSLFSSTYCVFEQISIQRMVFFYIYNLSCVVSSVLYKNNTS